MFGGEGSAEGAVLEREHLPDEQPRDGVEAEAKGRHEDDHARQGDPVQRSRGESYLELRLVERWEALVALIYGMEVQGCSKSKYVL